MRPIYISPPIIAVIATAVVYGGNLQPGSIILENTQVGGTVASIGATVLSLLLASLAILASIADKFLIKTLQKSGHYKNLLTTIFTGCCMFLLCSILGFIFLFGAPGGYILSSLLIGIHIGALASVIEIGFKFWKVLSKININPTPSPSI